MQLFGCIFCYTWGRILIQLNILQHCGGNANWTTWRGVFTCVCTYQEIFLAGFKILWAGRKKEKLKVRNLVGNELGHWTMEKPTSELESNCGLVQKMILA